MDCDDIKVELSDDGDNEDLNSYYSMSCVVYFQQKKSPLAEGRAACSEILSSGRKAEH